MPEKENLIETLDTVIQNVLSNLHTSTIAIVENVGDKVISCRPVINRQVNDKSIQLPVFSNVPPIFLQGGGSYISFPITQGDYCLLVFTERCFDRWYIGQDFESPDDLRMHDYSDGFAIVGINPQSSAISIPNTIAMQGDVSQVGAYTHTGDRTQTGTFTLNGNLIVNGTISADNFTGIGGGNLTSSVTLETTGDVVASGISLNSHTHGGVQPGGGNTGGPQ